MGLRNVTTSVPKFASAGKITFINLQENIIIVVVTITICLSGEEGYIIMEEMYKCTRQ